MIGVVGRLAGSQIGRAIGREALANIGGGGLRQVATQELERTNAKPADTRSIYKRTINNNDEEIR